jgi:CubicO group peptidase (beta-lactamase class C family)
VECHREDTPIAALIDNHAAYFHTGIVVHLLMIIPNYQMVLVMRMDTDGDFTDPGENSQLLSLMIINARLNS